MSANEARGTMKAVVMYEPGGPDVLKVETRPIPIPKPGEVLIAVKAFGLNRSELFTRRGLSPGVKLPRILGIEAVGVVAEAPGHEFREGDMVATVMGGMGRDFDGSYATYTCIAATHVRSIKSDLAWETLGAVPEMLQTAWGALFTSLRLEPSDLLLIRGGTTSVGLAAAAIAKSHGVRIAATTRNPERADFLRSKGAEHVFIDSGTIEADVLAAIPGGADKVLELVGANTLLDSLKCVKRGGIVCLLGMVGDKWELNGFDPMDAIETSTCLTSYAGENEDFMKMPFGELVDSIAAGKLDVQIGKVFHIDEIVEAHKLMDSNKAGGKIVVLT